MSYRRLLPSMTEYSQKFKRLDTLDFKIIRAMLGHSVYNVRKLAKAANAPQQTISYRIRRFDSEDLVRIRALISEARLGLKSYSVLASAPIGKEILSGSALTSFPLWRYLASVDGWKLGNYVRYAIPIDKERDLAAFLNELKKRELVSDFEIFQTESPNYPLLDLDFYTKKEGISLFDWQKWVEDFDSFAEHEPDTPDQGERGAFDLIDLIILRCLELDARTSQRRIVAEVARVLGEKKSKKFIPMVSRRISKNINPQGLIRGYRAYLFPNQELTALLLLFHFDFSNSSSLKEFIGALGHLPYNMSYEKILGTDSMFARFVVPIFEFPSMRKSLTSLAEKGYIKQSHLLIGELAHGTWDNVEIHQMFRDGAWNFSYGAAVEMLENTLRTITKNNALKKLA